MSCFPLKKGTRCPAVYLPMNPLPFLIFGLPFSFFCRLELSPSSLPSIYPRFFWRETVTSAGFGFPLFDTFFEDSTPLFGCNRKTLTRYGEPTIRRSPSTPSRSNDCWSSFLRINLPCSGWRPHENPCLPPRDRPVLRPRLPLISSRPLWSPAGDPGCFSGSTFLNRGVV